MDNRQQNWLHTIDNITNQFINKFGNLTSKQLNWKQNSNSWSVGQVIEHLIVTNEGYFKIPQTLQSQDFKPSLLTKFGFIPKMFGNMILKSVDPNTKRKIKTMKAFEPSSSQVQSDIVSKFEVHQKIFIDFINENIDLIKLKPVISSPANKHIVYQFDTAIDIIISHEQRHFNQAKEILELTWKMNHS